MMNTIFHLNCAEEAIHYPRYPYFIKMSCISYLALDNSRWWFSIRILINIKQKKKEIHKEGQQSTCCLHIGAKIDQHEFYYFVVYNQCCKLIPHANIMNT